MAKDSFSFKKARTAIGAALAAPVIALTPVNNTDAGHGEIPVTITHHTNVIPTNPDVLFSGHKWLKQDPTDISPLIITYKFMELDTSKTAKKGEVVTTPYTAEQRTAFRQATQEFERFANVKFVEFRQGVKTNAADIDPKLPMIEVSTKSKLEGRNNKGELLEFLGYAPFPYSRGSPANTTSDIVSSLKKTEERKSVGNYVVHHEIGHNLGLKHPVDSLPRNAFSVRPEEDAVEISIMSNKSVAAKSQFGKDKYLIKREDGFTPAGLMPLDAAALQKLYGANTSYNLPLDTHYFTDGANDARTIWNGGKPYTLDARNVTPRDEREAIKLDANPGRVSIVGNELMFNPLDAVVTTLRGSDKGTTMYKGSEKGGTVFEGGKGANLYEFFGKGNRISTPAGAQLSMYAPYPGAEATVEGFDPKRDHIVFPYPKRSAVSAVRDGDDMIIEMRLGRTDSARMILKNFKGNAQDIHIRQATTNDTTVGGMEVFKRVDIVESAMPGWLYKMKSRDNTPPSR